MVDLSLERPGEHLHIRSVGATGIRIGGQLYSGSVLLTTDTVLTGWPPRDMSELQVEHLQTIFDLRPDVALLGTGPGHEMLPRELQIALYRLGAGLEVMSTAAACRTFNVLAGDGRRVVAGLLPMRLG